MHKEIEKKKQPQKRKIPEPEPEPEYDLFADALPTTSKNVQPCSKQTDNQDLPAQLEHSQTVEDHI